MSGDAPKDVVGDAVARVLANASDDDIRIVLRNLVVRVRRDDDIRMVLRNLARAVQREGREPGPDK